MEDSTRRDILCLKKREMISRRGITLGGLAAAACLCGGKAALGAAPSGGRFPIGLESFTILPNLDADFEGAVSAVARIGYVEIETIGSFARDPVYVRDVFKRFGLKSPSQHVFPDPLARAMIAYTRGEMARNDILEILRTHTDYGNLTPLIEDAIIKAKIMGQTYIVWPSIQEGVIADRASVDKLAADFNRLGALCRREGLQFGFHNHEAEFKVKDGFRPYDRLMATTDPDLVKTTLDFYWAEYGGADPLQLLGQYRGRIRQCHLKDRARDGSITGVGQGVIDFRRLIGVALASGVEHFYVEYDKATRPMEESASAYRYLHALRL